MYDLGNYALGIPSSQPVWLYAHVLCGYIDRAPVTSSTEREPGTPGAVLTMPVSLFILRGERNLLIPNTGKTPRTDAYICNLMAFLFPLSYIFSTVDKLRHRCYYKTIVNTTQYNVADQFLDDVLNNSSRDHL